MTESKSQESCIATIKKWCIEFYKAPCFWLKIIPLAILISLAAIGLYQIVTSAFHYFRKPLSYFDPERLGQLGDFLGGTLNPIFGFATVCLLLWSVFIQRKELSLTRAELKKSSAALQGQLDNNVLEHKIMLLEKSATYYISEIEKIADEKIVFSSLAEDTASNPNRSMNDIIYDDRFPEGSAELANQSFSIERKIYYFKNTVILLKENVIELKTLSKTTGINNYWDRKVRYWLENCVRLNLINPHQIQKEMEDLDRKTT